MAVLIIALAAVGLIMTSLPDAGFDTKKITLIGVVSEYRWRNPHAWVVWDVKDESGKIVSWEVELGPPAGLMRRGWSRNTLKVGESVIVNGFVAKDGSNLTNAQTVTLSDGRKVFAGSSADGTTP